MKTFALAIAATLTAVLHAAAAPIQGTVHPEKSVSVSSPVLQEVISEIPVKEGQTVKEGDVIVQLRNDRERLDVEISKKLIELKTFIARGQERLYKEEMGSEEKALEAKTDLELARLQLAAKQVALEEKTIRAPLSGIVVKKYKERGESVDRVEKVVDIINIDRVFGEFFIPSNLRASVAEGQHVRLKVPDLNDAEFDGVIDFVSPRNEPDSPLVRVKALVDNRDHRIKPGMAAFAEFDSKGRQ